MNLIQPKLALFFPFEQQTHLQPLVKIFLNKRTGQISLFVTFSVFFPKKLTGSRTLLKKYTGSAEPVEPVPEEPLNSINKLP